MDNRECNETLCIFRREKLKELQQQLESCAAGHDHIVMPFITNRQGQYSEQKTIQLVNRLTDGLYAKAGFSISEPLHSFYKSMLYCAIRTFSTPCTVQNGSVTLGIYNSTFTFGDLISYLHSEEFETSENSRQSMSFGILKRPINGILSISMTALYMLLSGKEKPNPDLLDGEFVPLHTFEAQELCPEEANEYDPYYEEFLGAKPCRLEGVFPSPEKFCEHYENILKLFPQQYQQQDFDHHIETMIDHFLIEQDMTIFSDRDTYLTAIVNLKKTLKTLQAQRQ